MEAARTRLAYWDVAPEVIAAIESSGEVMRTLTVASPIDGVIIALEKEAGEMVVGSGFTRDVIYAAVAVYLLLGAVFVPLYGLLDTLTFELSSGAQHAFVGGSASGHALFAWQDFIYYSYVTLTTLGYGDITPMTRAAKNLAALEAIFGQLYLAILIARLVGQQALGDKERED